MTHLAGSMGLMFSTKYSHINDGLLLDSLDNPICVNPD